MSKSPRNRPGHVAKKAWTKEEDAILRKARGKVSAYYVGAQLGRTRNSIIGRWHRLGMCDFKGLLPEKRRPHPQKPLSSKPEQSPMMRQPARRRSLPKPPRAPPPEAVWLPLEGITPVTFMDLEADHCRWPVTGGYCGCQREENSSYCSTHRAIAGNPPPPLRLRPPHGTSLSP